VQAAELLGADDCVDDSLDLAPEEEVVVALPGLAVNLVSLQIEEVFVEGGQAILRSSFTYGLMGPEPTLTTSVVQAGVPSIPDHHSP